MLEIYYREFLAFD